MVYCADRLRRESRHAALILVDLGYRQVYVFEGGVAEWRRQALPLVGAAAEASAA